MKGKRIDYVLAVALVAVFGRVPAAQAIPVNADTLNYQGALFTLEGAWHNGKYVMTYRANFDQFEGGEEYSYLKAIDWKWGGGAVSTVSLLDAPGGAENWVANTFMEADFGDSAGCKKSGDSNAVCTKFTGTESGLPAYLQGDLSWVFEINFKYISQMDVFLGDGPSAAYLKASASLASPILWCGSAGESSCPQAVTDNPAPGSTDVPAPGVPALLIPGFAGLLWWRRKRPAPARIALS